MAELFENNGKYLFNYEWKFLIADAFPLKNALADNRDRNGLYFYEPDYDDTGWKKVTLPHTFNDVDLFKDRIQDAGSGQKRTFAFYRKWFEISSDVSDKKIILEFEGIRQTCYLYVNGNLAGYYEAGTAPFGIEISKWIQEGKNLIAIATDNTSTRNIAFCAAETPNKQDAEPGSYLFSQNEKVLEEHEGVGFFWNCNDFNPSVGGLTRNVILHIKKRVYLTLPLFSNLRTKGSYVYPYEFDIEHKKARVCIEAEIRNETDTAKMVCVEAVVKGYDGRECFRFSSEKIKIEAAGNIEQKLSIVPEDAYIKKECSSGAFKYVPADEDKVKPTITDSYKTSVIKLQSQPENLRFWSIDDPYLYKVEILLKNDDEIADREEITTGFRKIAYDCDRGVLVNDETVWLRGYAQRASNEWAAIGIAPEWLKDQDAMWIKESNANHIRWMHVAASPADIRALDRHGIICTQPAGDKEKENFKRQWDQRVELMRDIIIYFRNHPSIVFWEAGNNSINKKHMHEMKMLKDKLDPYGGRFMGCRTINTEEVILESEYTGTMLNRHAARFIAKHGPITETEYSREESPRRVWDDFTPPDYDYDNNWMGKGSVKRPGGDFYDLTAEEFALTTARGYSEFFNDRIGGASGNNWYSACAALCWTDSAQHGRQAYSENARMSGRVDPVRIKKQNFYVFKAMQSVKPEVKIIGHWNYPPADKENYRYPVKEYDGEFWVKTGKMAYRDPEHKTVYVAASYCIKRVELYINGKLAGECSRPEDSFIYKFENIDVTQNGMIKAIGYSFDNDQAEDIIFTAGKPDKLKLTVHTSPYGMRADGADVAYADVEVLDADGRICPLCSDKIQFTFEGCGEFLGGYNSGRFDGYGRNDSVIHKDYVFAECGINRVFIRSGFKAGKLKLTASMEGIKGAEAVWQSVMPGSEKYDPEKVLCIAENYDIRPEKTLQYFPAIKEADEIKYKKEDVLYCKVLVNGQEPDTRGVRSVNSNGRIWGAFLCILPRLKAAPGAEFEYEYDEIHKKLIINTDGHRIEAEAGKTHLLVDGEENLMDGEPYVSQNGIFVMEISAVASYIKGVQAWYDDKINVYRIETNSFQVCN